ncbi:hypothetical protein BDB01DRAFT_336908 [Pilobolus umbonatus]|nr:hypothetical protein BDB01DRAFT_336908 [Pilobolus umbonatus]
MLNHTNINWKYASLFILVLQNSMLILTMRYTRASVPEDKLYLASTAVLMSEVLKTLLCFSAIYYLLPNPSLKGLLLFLYRELFIFWKESIQMAIPAILYLIQVSLCV